MAEYTLVVRIPSAGDRAIHYSINLEGLLESYPEDYFRQPIHREEIAKAIQSQSARQLSTHHLNAAIDKWIDEIGLGVRRTHITLELPAEGIGTTPPPLGHPAVKVATATENSPPTTTGSLPPFPGGRTIDRTSPKPLTPNSSPIPPFPGTERASTPEIKSPPPIPPRSGIDRAIDPTPPSESPEPTNTYVDGNRADF
jgi:hypothetical protein